MNEVALSVGRTHYELTGPEDGEVVVLLHGALIPMWVWDRQVPALVAAGYRVLRYDMFGKGRSESPNVVYVRALYRHQLIGLLDALRITGKVHLIGFSFGGGTAANVAVSHPDRVASIVLLAPVLRFEEANRSAELARTPIFGRLLMHLVVMKKISARAARLWAAADDADRCAERFAEQLTGAGFEAALYSFLRTDALGDLSGDYRILGSLGHAVLMLWGSLDQDIPRAHIDKIRALLPKVEFHEMPGVTHGLTFSHADAVNAHLVNFLQKQPS